MKQLLETKIDFSQKGTKTKLKININYTILDTIEVPDHWDYRKIQQRCRENWFELMTPLNEVGTVPDYDDMEFFEEKNEISSNS